MLQSEKKSETDLRKAMLRPVFLTIEVEQDYSSRPKKRNYSLCDLVSQMFEEEPDTFVQLMLGDLEDMIVTDRKEEPHPICKYVKNGMKFNEFHFFMCRKTAPTPPAKKDSGSGR